MIGAIKKWEEIDLEEKVERLRQRFQDVKYLNARIYKLESMVKRLSNHQHNHHDGSVVIDIKSIENELNGSTTASMYDTLA